MIAISFVSKELHSCSGYGYINEIQSMNSTKSTRNVDILHIRALNRREFLIMLNICGSFKQRQADLMVPQAARKLFFKQTNYFLLGSIPYVFLPQKLQSKFNHADLYFGVFFIRSTLSK